MRETHSIRLDQALAHIRARAYLFTRFAPDDVHIAAVARLTLELLEQYDTLEIEIEVPNQIYCVIVTTQVGCTFAF
ncbi:MAG: hypothetical protein JXA33_11475 [Anaerolineae bacterium]|nr:hypothetical protein [Anaerolineae bacterium]